MKNTDKYNNIISEHINKIVSLNKNIASISTTCGELIVKRRNKKNDRSIIIDFIDTNSVIITLSLNVYYSDTITIPELSFEIQEDIKKQIMEIFSLNVKYVNINIVGIISK